MAIELLTICEWIASGMERVEISRPTWEQVERAIRELDEESHNDVYLTPETANPETYLAIGGGKGRYLVTGSINNERFPTVAKAVERNDARERLVVGGQTGYYPSNWILDIDNALRAARSFYETGDIGGDGLTWVDA